MTISISETQQDTVRVASKTQQDTVRVITKTQQDTVRAVKFNINESIRENTYSLPPVRQFALKDTGKHFVATKAIVPSTADTTSVCTRNSIADVTFYDPDNIVFKIKQGNYKQFPFVFIEKGMQRQAEERALLIKQLKPGNDLAARPLHTDWMIIVILIAAFLYSLVKASSKSMMPYFERSFIFRGTNDPSTRDIGGLFHWQSTILNLISFLIIGLFGYSVVSFYGLIPSGFRGIIIWLITLAIISSAITLRHIVCMITGAASGKQEVFREYLIGIYQAYRLVALVLFVIIVLMAYTLILPVRDYIISGIFIVGLMYLVRIIRLLIIFLNRNISIFYLILYLCALEILPVLIIVKYFTGLV